MKIISQEEKQQIEFLYFQMKLMEQRVLEKYKLSPQLMVDALISRAFDLIKTHASSRNEGLGFLLDSITQSIHSAYKKD